MRELLQILTLWRMQETEEWCQAEQLFFARIFPSHIRLWPTNLA